MPLRSPVVYISAELTAASRKPTKKFAGTVNSTHQDIVCIEL